MSKKTVIAEGVSITSKGVIYTSGQEVSADDFVSKEVFDVLMKRGKVVEVQDTSDKAAKAAAEKAAAEKAAAEKAAAEKAAAEKAAAEKAAGGKEK